MDTALASPQEYVSRLNSDQFSETFKKQNQMIVINEFLPENYVRSTLVPETINVEKYINRVNIPGFKKSGSVSAQCLKQQAPNLYSLYHSASMLSYVENLVGVKLVRCPERDPHAIALYYYTEPGDRIGIHYDRSFYRGERYTVLLGLIQDSSLSKLLCYPNGRRKGPHNIPQCVATTPGKLIVFNGNTLWHEVTALGNNEKRVTLTMEFLTDPRMSRISKFISDCKDRFLYFGKKYK